MLANNWSIWKLKESKTDLKIWDEEKEDHVHSQQIKFNNFKGSRMVHYVKAFLWCVTLIINTSFRFLKIILE